MEYRLSRHAQEEATRRQIPPAWLDAVLARPEQQIPESGNKVVLQSRLTDNHGKMYLVRVIVATDKEPPVVITVYRTSKIEKYWKP